MIKVHKISFKEADGGYTCSEQDILENELSKLGLYSPGLGYSAFNPALLRLVLETGTFHRQDQSRKDNIDCCKVDLSISEIRDNDETDLIHYIDCSAENNKGAFAVYDLSLLKEREEEGGHPYYQFKNPENKLEALLAVVEVTW
jgi:hypothetical protein